MVTRYEDVLGVFKDPRFSVDLRKGTDPGMRLNSRWMPRAYRVLQSMLCEVVAQRAEACPTP